jgi:uncharacterized protein with HEPN domain
MHRDVEKHLVDILEAARDVQGFVGDKSFDEYRSDRMLKAAVERKFEIIGEALTRVARLSSETAAAIREYQKIIAFRNFVIHKYDAVSDPLVWDVIEQKLPLLVEDVSRLQDD